MVKGKGSMDTMTIQELEQLIAQAGREIYSFCLHLTGDKMLADDLYQDTFLKAVEKLNQLEADGNPKSYLLSVACRLWKNQKRKFAWRNRIAPTETFDEERRECAQTAEDVLQDYLLEEERGIVRKAVSKLEDKYKIPVLLYYMEDLSVAEVAGVLGIPSGTVKSRLSVARKRLGSELEGYFNE